MTIDHQEILSALVFTTPPDVLDLVLSPDQSAETFSVNDIRARLKQSLLMQTLIKVKMPAVYCVDQIAIPHKNRLLFTEEIKDPQKQPDLLNDVIGAIARVRSEVAAWLRENGVTVIEIGQSYYSKIGTLPSQARQSPVGVIKQNPDFVYKRRTVQPSTHLQDPETIQIPHHPNLANEIVHRKPGGEYITIAQRFPEDHTTVFNLQNHRKDHEILSYILQAMKGCEHLHSHGYVHGDVKPDNIIVLPKTNVALLSDLEGITKIGEKRSHLALPYYDESEYYHRDGQVNVDENNDVFSFGITLLGDISTLIPQNYIDEQKDRWARKNRNRVNEVQDALHQYIDRYRPFMNGRLKKLIKAMTLEHRNGRPTLHEAIAELAQIIEEIKQNDVGGKRGLFE